MRNTLIFFVLLLTCMSCQSSNNKASEMAADVCACFKPLVDVSDEVQTMLQNNQGSEAELLLPNISQLQKEGQKCAASLVDKYGANTSINTEDIKASMKEKCPKIIETLGETLFAK